MSMFNIDYLPLEMGQIVSVNTIDEHEPPFRSGQSSKETIILYETIDHNRFPSYNDYFGESIQVELGEMAIVTKFVGRPTSMSLYLNHNRDSDHEKSYIDTTSEITRALELPPGSWGSDIYEIFIRGGFKQALRCSLMSMGEDLNYHKIRR